MGWQGLGEGEVTRQVAEILAECPRCRVEGALLEQIATEAVASCRMCGYALVAGEVSAPGRGFYTVADVAEALTAWALAEGVDDVHDFVRQNFLDERLDLVADRVLAREPVPTNFDVLAWLLPGFGAGVNLTASLPVLPPVLVPPRAPEGPSVDPLAARRAAITVAIADGRMHPAELALLGDVDPAELRVWRPIDVGRPEDPAAAVAMMVRVARADGEVDRSEVRVIHEFARAWGVPFDPELLPTGGSLERSVGALWRGLVP